MASRITITDHERVRCCTLDRPEKLNAFDDVSYDELAAALVAADADSGVHVVVLTGAGRAFSAGVDLTAMQDPEVVSRLGPAFDGMLDTIDAFSKPLIAAVNGLAVGIGATILLHCDLVLADATARFRTPFPQLGTTPEAGSSLLLPRLAGPQFAKRMFFTGDWIDADTAFRVGMIAEVTAEGAALERALALAAELAEHPSAALAAAKRLVDEGWAEATRAARAREVREAQGLAAEGVVSPLTSR